jgi:hypothetical protein
LQSDISCMISFFVLIFGCGGGGSSLKHGSHYVAQADLELSTLQSQLPKCWDNRRYPLCSARAVGFLASLLSPAVSH